jgi:hypothetical protein
MVMQITTCMHNKKSEIELVAADDLIGFGGASS